MTPDRPPLTPYLLRFAAGYSAFLLVAVAIVSALDMKLGSGAIAGILVSASFYATGKFAETHQRPFSRAEFHTMLWGSLVIDLILQLLLVALTVPALLNTGAMAVAMVIVAIVHLPAIAFVNSDWMMKRAIAGAIKRRARRDARGAA